MTPPPGWERRAVEEYRPAGTPPRGAIWYVAPHGGYATAICFDEAEAVARAWALAERMGAWQDAELPQAVMELV